MATKQTDKINIICLPYAGGHKYAYRNFSEVAPPFLNFITIEYPGRLGRMKEPVLTDLNELAEDVFKQIPGEVFLEPYAIYGHSMGGLLAWLLTHKIIESGWTPPIHIFITGTTGPGAPSRQQKIRYNLPAGEFIREMRELDGIPEDILNNDELLSFFEPILRGDFKACETYVYERKIPMNIPVTVITGTEENMEEQDIRLWQNETTAAARFLKLPGKHFFIHKLPYDIIKIIAKTLHINLL